MALVRTDVSKENISSVTRVEITSEIRAALSVTSNGS
jgi:hypothetical protein